MKSKGLLAMGGVAWLLSSSCGFYLVMKSILYPF